MKQRAKLELPRFDLVPGHTFTYEYRQPKDYAFCQDSIIFPWYVARQLLATHDAGALTSFTSLSGRLAHPDFRVLDLCAGCGVIGFELAHYLPQIQNIDFMEVQDVFLEAFQANLLITKNNGKNFRFLLENYEQLNKPNNNESRKQTRPKYDLIICNPPYFFSGEGLPAPNPVKNRSRFFIDSTLDRLIEGIANSLRPGGVAYVLLKDGSAHGRNALADVQATLAGTPLRARLTASIRGTAVLLINTL